MADVNDQKSSTDKARDESAVLQLGSTGGNISSSSPTPNRRGRGRGRGWGRGPGGKQRIMGVTVKDEEVNFTIPN